LLALTHFLPPFLTELLHIRNSLPDSVVVQRVDERLSALGNCIACNDYVGLIHTDLDRVSGSYQSLQPVASYRGRQTWVPSIKLCFWCLIGASLSNRISQNVVYVSGERIPEGTGTLLQPAVCCNQQNSFLAMEGIHLT
jgi:hypothetical protein